MANLRKTPESSNLLKIGDVVLSQEAINQLEELQNESNSLSTYFIEKLSDAVGYLIGYEMESKKEEIYPIVQDLNDIRNIFKILRKP